MIGPTSDKNDPFEEFEFRPINEGLGFHRKNKAQPTVASTPAQATPAVTTPSSPTTKAPQSRPAGASASPFTSTLPRHETPTKKTSFTVPTIEDDSIAKAQTAVNEILKTLNQKRQLDFATETEKQRVQLKKSKPQFFAAVLDSMLVIAAFLMTLILMLSITKVDMIMNLTHAETSGMVYLATLALFAGVTFIYMVVNRAFLGYTPGEWAFDQQCGEAEEQNDLMYIPKIALRTLVVMATGFVITPILSYLFNKDVAGQISGVTLYKKPFGL